VPFFGASYSEEIGVASPSLFHWRRCFTSLCLWILPFLNREKKQTFLAGEQVGGLGPINDEVSFQSLCAHNHLLVGAGGKSFRNTSYFERIVGLSRVSLLFSPLSYFPK
jgi:hypothetical protein